MLNEPELPKRRYDGKIADPERWLAFTPRAGDIVVSTPPKSGTTWTQAILALLISGDPEVDAAISRKAPWIDVTSPEQDGIIADLNAQTGRRQVKTHTPLDGIPFWSDLRYITVFRHPIDVHFSFRRHVENMTEEVLQEVFPRDVQAGFHLFLEGDHRDGASLISIVDHYRSVLAFGDRENVLCLHYADMTRDLRSAVARIAEHIGLTHPPALMETLVEAARFSNMKRNAERFAVLARQGFWRNDSDFFDSATSGKWVGRLSDADLAAYEARMAELLSPEERHWLEYGSAGLLKTG
ncbi:sulfotransferase domain-containing protein [Phaeobacter piscinae]|uniref:sulfotransferase domain-containing protein n=1 Tax=Phaeobacter piscinae TaxID=1580596 RepID=UPI000C9A18CB|nr:sulfotransferase domain-containing protein [Phaeobacter piscinae]AUQ74185.1 Glycolipid sulfotransferase [Phaeobacter piscinae]